MENKAVVSEGSEEEKEKDKEKSRGRIIWEWSTFILFWVVLFGGFGFFLWKTNFYDTEHQSPIECTVTSVEEYTRTSGGARFSSSTDYLAFDTKECSRLMLRLFGNDDAEEMIRGIEVGKKYEFMIMSKDVGSSRDERETFSYSGPLE